jgi:DNA-binding MarR family transcriptional regulator
MTESKTPLPPFAALRAFHAAAVHGRFRDAALSLGLTESSISHQVRRLEDFLRTALFDRSGPGVRLTAAGRRYLEQIDPAIRQIQSATEAMLRPSGRNVVRLTLPPSLAATWLIPQLSAFERPSATPLRSRTCGHSLRRCPSTMKASSCATTPAPSGTSTTTTRSRTSTTPRSTPCYVQ